MILINRHQQRKVYPEDPQTLVTLEWQLPSVGGAQQIQLMPKPEAGMGYSQCNH